MHYHRKRGKGLTQGQIGQKTVVKEGVQFALKFAWWCINLIYCEGWHKISFARSHIFLKKITCLILTPLGSQAATCTWWFSPSSSSTSTLYNPSCPGTGNSEREDAKVYLTSPDPQRETWKIGFPKRSSQFYISNVFFSSQIDIVQVETFLPDQPCGSLKEHFFRRLHLLLNRLLKLLLKERGRRSNNARPMIGA